MEARTRVQQAAAQVAAAAIGREAEARGLVLAAIAGEHALLVGPPGSAKSMIARALARAVRASYYEVLLGAYSTPDEVFGPPDLGALANGELRRRGAGYLQSVEFAFLDEIFRAGQGVLGALLGALNERVYHEGGRAVPIPLRAATAATNHWPDDDGLAAVVDRFLVRHVVRYVPDDARERVIFDALPPAGSPAATIEDLDHARGCARGTPYSEAARAAYLAAVAAAEEAGGGRLSDRRVRAASMLPRAAAWLDGSARVEPAHVADAWPALWQHPDHADRVRSAVLRVADPDAARADDLARAVGEEAGKIPAASPGDAVALAARLSDLARDAGRLGARGAAVAAYARREAARAQCRALGVDPASPAGRALVEAANG